MGLFRNKKNIYLVTITVAVKNKVAISEGWIERERLALRQLADDEGNDAELAKLVEQGIEEVDVAHLQVKCWGHAENAVTAGQQSVAAIREIDGVLTVASGIRGWVPAGQRDLEAYREKAGMSAESAGR